VIANDVGASTKVIYSHFGGMSGLIAALYEDGFARLTSQLVAAIEGGEPIGVRLNRAAHAYRTFAVANSQTYELMYGPRIRDLLPTKASRKAASPVQNAIAGLLREGQEQNLILDGDPEDQSRLLWTVMHGAVSLELTTWFDPAEGSSRFDQVVAMAISAMSTK